MLQNASRGVVTCGLFLLLSVPVELHAGGSGLNILVVVNQNSSESKDLGNYYCEKRSIPPENVLRISWAGANTSWTATDFTTVLLEPLLEALTTRNLTNQIEYVLLSMDIPFQTIWSGTNYNSTTSALFYGLKVDNGADAGSLNSYAASEKVFSLAKPDTAPGASFLTTMLTGTSLEAAKQLVDQGVAGDGRFPIQPVILAKSSDPNRNVRSSMFDDTIFDVRILGVSSIIRTNSDSPAGLTNMLGYETGLDRYSVSPGTFVSGSIADSMTSFGGIIFGPNDQTNLLAFINAGASGSYGTVAEPGADVNKFPNPMVYFYQARGFSLAESYYQSVNQPYLGLTVGEPLSAPFAAKASGSWAMELSNAVFSAVTTMGVSFKAHDSTRPLQRLDLFMDGRFHGTLTNVSPTAGNLLKIELNGYPISYAVPTNATITGIASAVAGLINDPVVTNATQARALPFGDRIELQAIGGANGSYPYYVNDTSADVLHEETYRVSYLTEAFPPKLIPDGINFAGLYQMQMEIPTPLNYVVEASTNLISWMPIFTNTLSGLVEFCDPDSTNYARRFYRVAGPVPNLPPAISFKPSTNGGGLEIEVESQSGQPCAVLMSTNLQNWLPVATNQAGGVWSYDVGGSNQHFGFYRAMLVPTPQPSLVWTNPAPATTLVRVAAAAQPYTVERSTNGLDWTAVTTNIAFCDYQIAATSELGAGNSLTTGLRASRPALLDSKAYGVQYYTFFAATLTVGAGAEFLITKTNGETVVLSATNYTAGASATNIGFAIYNAIRTNSALQGSDGVSAEDYNVNAGGQAKFTVRARSPGLQAAQIGVLPKVSGFATGVSVSPGSYRTLTRHPADLQPRDHLYVTAGVGKIDAAFPLDTTELSDGWHTLTAVAYEGTSVRAQTHRSVMVVVSNTTLQAQLSLPTNSLPVNSIFNVSVTANTNSVGEILIFTTGGFLLGATNQPAAIFAVDGSLLGAGQHPFHALITTTNGFRYRTQTRNITLTRP